MKLPWGGNEDRAPTCFPRYSVEELPEHPGAPSCQQLQPLPGNVKAQAGQRGRDCREGKPSPPKGLPPTSATRRHCLGVGAQPSPAPGSVSLPGFLTNTDRSMLATHAYFMS